MNYNLEEWWTTSLHFTKYKETCGQFPTRVYHADKVDKLLEKLSQKK